MCFVTYSDWNRLLRKRYPAAFWVPIGTTMKPKNLKVKIDF
jgi:hypothetical protein